MLRLWLAFKIFGNGYGLTAPYYQQAFYWYKTQFYTWIGGFGAQLTSFEWSAPAAGTTRTIFGREFVVFQVSRRWLLVDVSWTSLDRMNAIEDIHELKKILPR